MEEKLASFVNVILPFHLPQLYTYRVPASMEAQVEKGKRVIVQFGKSRMYSAVVHAVHDRPPQNYEAKYILDVLDDNPIISPEMILFWEWMASYYMCSLGDVMQAALPAPFKLESTTTVKLHPENDISGLELSDKEFLIIEALTQHDQLSINEIAAIVQQKNVFGLLRSLHIKEAILLNEEVKGTYKPRYISCVNLTTPYQEDTVLEKLFDSLAKKEGQLNLVMAYLQMKHETSDVEKTILSKEAMAAKVRLKH